MNSVEMLQNFLYYLITNFDAQILEFFFFFFTSKDPFSSQFKLSEMVITSCPTFSGKLPVSFLWPK